jgi:hypothetical protein
VTLRDPVAGSETADVGREHSMPVVQLSPEIMLSLLGLGATSIAAWFYVRFPKAAPETMARLVTHLILAALIIQFIVPTGLGIADGSVAARLFGIFAIGFPALVYCMLTCLWMLAWATQMLARHR